MYDQIMQLQCKGINNVGKRGAEFFLEESEKDFLSG